MPGLVFEQNPTIAAVSPNRADIVCFVGFVSRRRGALPTGVKQWLQENGWRSFDGKVDDHDDLLNTPVPVESFETFNQVFAWDERPVAYGGFAFPTWLGAAVHAFFRQGGLRCFVVRVEDPWPFELTLPAPSDDAAHARQTLADLRLNKLFPGIPGLAVENSTIPSRQNAKSWKGIGALLGLDEAAMVCFPDLPEIVADSAVELFTPLELPATEERFVECSQSIATETEAPRIPAAPACTENGFKNWFYAAHYAARFVRQNRRDVQLVLALPLPADDKQTNLSKMLTREKYGFQAVVDDEFFGNGISSAFLQVAFPWLITSWSETLPGGIESPDGVLAGSIARSVAARGAFRCAANELLRGVQDFVPALSQQDVDLSQDEHTTLIHRVSLLGPSPTGPRILSDVTTSLSEAHRPASVGRLTAAILRTAQRVGEALVFEPSGPELWRKIEDRLDALLANFYAAGALNGETQNDAYSLCCDETTNSRNDLDNGRVFVEVRFAPAHPIDLITVVLSLRDGTVAVVEGPA